MQDDYVLTLPPGLTDGEYRLITGMYSLPEVKRLPVHDSSGAAQGDYLDLGTVTLEGGRVMGQQPP